MNARKFRPIENDTDLVEHFRKIYNVKFVIFRGRDMAFFIKTMFYKLLKIVQQIHAYLPTYPSEVTFKDKLKVGKW